MHAGVGVNSGYSASRGSTMPLQGSIFVGTRARYRRLRTTARCAPARPRRPEEGLGTCQRIEDMPTSPCDLCQSTGCWRPNGHHTQSMPELPGGPLQRTSPPHPLQVREKWLETPTGSGPAPRGGAADTATTRLSVRGRLFDGGASAGSGRALCWTFTPAGPPKKRRRIRDPVGMAILCLRCEHSVADPGPEEAG